MKRVLITGASGFVGANLARRSLAEGHEVHLLLRPQHSLWRIEGIRPHVRIHPTGLADAGPLAALVAGIRPDWVFHLAAHGAYPSQTDAREMMRTNVLGTMNLVEACLKTGFDAFVNAGSSSEYGFKDHAPGEDETLEPNSDYAVTKASATLYCRHVARQHRVPLSTLRLYSVYGPYEEPSRLLPTLIVRGLNGELPRLVNPDIARDYVQVDDVCGAFISAAEGKCEPGAVFNVGTGAQTSIRQVVEVARRMLDLAVEPQWGSMPDRSWDSAVWVADHRRITKALGWKPTHSFEEGFRAMLDWFRIHPRVLDHYCTALSRA